MTEEIRFKCVFYPALECPVQQAMADLSMSEKIEPLDSSVPEKMMSDIVKAFGQSMGMIFASLANFCCICPFKREKEQEGRTGTLFAVGPAPVGFLYQLQLSKIYDELGIHDIEFYFLAGNVEWRAERE